MKEGWQMTQAEYAEKCRMIWVDESPCKGADQECPECKTKTTPYKFEESPVARIQTYMKTGGAACPYCGSPDIGVSLFHYEIDGTGVRQEVGCNDCGKEWTDTYTLSSVIESDGNIIDRID